MLKEDRIKIKIHCEYADLYFLGYLTKDLFEIVAISEAIDKQDDIITNNLKKERPTPYNRLSKPLRKYRDSSKIKKVSDGSIDIILPIVSTTVSIILYILSRNVAREAARQELTSAFEINPEDAQLADLLDHYENGKYGHGPDGINTFFAILRDHEYNIELRGQNAYIISHLLDRNVTRTIQMIRLYHP